MKKNTLIICLLSLFTLPLVACNEPANEITITPEIVKNALASVKESTHKINIKQTVSVLRPAPEGMTPEDPEWMHLPLDIYQEYNHELVYYYENGEKAFSRQSSRTYADLDKLTGELIPNSVRHYDTPLETFFKNNEDGTAYLEHIDINNNLSKPTSANYDDQTGIYSPIVFDSEFKNPFDFISYRDIEVTENGKTLRLINDKADFLAECYDSIGLNFITNNEIVLNNDGKVSSIIFTIDDLKGETWTRTNTLEITYSYSDDLKINHLNEYTNNNPALSDALKVLNDKKNYTYIKELSYSYVDGNGNNVDFADRIKAYFTEEEVYFHHETSENDTHPYINGDDYDYKVKLNEDGKYTCYEYTPDGVSFNWGIVMLSGSTPYIIDTFEEIGPSFGQMNPAIFAKTDENRYDIEPELLSISGKYFDFGMMGCQSYALDGNTTQLTITLDDNGNIEMIESAFIFNMIQFKLKFYIQDIGTTSIPEWSELSMPVPEYNENA